MPTRRLLGLQQIRLGTVGNQKFAITNTERKEMTPTNKPKSLRPDLLERIEARIFYNCAFNDPDEDTQLLIETAAYLKAAEYSIDWQEIANDIFLKGMNNAINDGGK